MRSEYYYQFQGIQRAIASPAAPQVSALFLENYLPNRFAGGWVKRPGSKAWATDGDVLGIGGYTQANPSYRTPQTIHPIRHRRVGTTSHIERYDAEADTWVEIPQTAYTGFSDNGLTTFAQVSNLMVIAAGRPGYLTDPESGTVGRLGGPPPTTAPVLTAVAGSLSGGAYGYYTFYNPTTGWESSPSPASNFLELASNSIQWSALETSVQKAGATQKRLYRTQTSAEPPYYRVATIPLAQATYLDSVIDANLGPQGPDFDDHDAPPEDVYTCIEYEGHIFLASGNVVYFSKPYTGSLADLEYYSAARTFILPQRVTGFGYSPDFGRLFVFQPVGYGIHTISGRSEADFYRQLYKKEDGTNFPTSVASHGNMLAYWGENGPTIITPSGIVENFGADVKELVRIRATTPYDSDVTVFTVFNPVWGQSGTFLFFFGASSVTAGGAVWQDVNTGAVTAWQDVITGVGVEWQ